MNRKLSFVLVFCAFTCFPAFTAAQENDAAALKTKNVFLIVADGLRWQEVFTGADPELLKNENGGSWMGEEELKKRYWSNDAQERRAKLFPFLWTTVAKEGQLFGNRTKSSDAHVTNGKAFSYPGYNEILTGVPDSKIDSNEFGPNPNVTVLEWLDKQPDLRGRVAVVGTWATYSDIFNVKRSHLPVFAGWEIPARAAKNGSDATLRELYATSTRFDEEDVSNAFLQFAARDYLKASHPRVLFLGYGETDNWAHQGRYDLVLGSAHQFDQFVAELWKIVQSDPKYRGTTTFIITTDHGRGNAPVQWKEHGVDEKGSENIWIAVIGPDTPALGERSNDTVTQSQIAATVAALLGKDYRKDVPAAGPVLQDVIARKP